MGVTGFGKVDRPMFFNSKKKDVHEVDQEFIVEEFNEPRTVTDTSKVADVSEVEQAPVRKVTQTSTANEAKEHSYNYSKGGDQKGFQKGFDKS